MKYYVKILIVSIFSFYCSIQYACISSSLDLNEIGELWYYPFDIDRYVGINEEGAEEEIKCSSFISKGDFLKLISPIDYSGYDSHNVRAVIKFLDETYYIDQELEVRSDDRYYYLENVKKFESIFKRSMKCKG